MQRPFVVISCDSQCDFISIAGCVNGGGQIRPPTGVSPAEWLQRVRSAYEQAAPLWPAHSVAALALHTASDVPTNADTDSTAAAAPALPAKRVALSDDSDSGVSSLSLLRDGVSRLGAASAGQHGALWHTQYHEVKPTEGLLGAMKW